jgi:hypothetical protein
MKSHTPRPDQSLTWIIIAYYIAVGLLIYGAFSPDGRVWGFNWWHFVPLWMQITLGAIGLGAPLLICRVSKGEYLLNQTEAAPMSAARFWLMSCGGIAVVAALFWLGRNQTHFLGDGYQIVANLERHSQTHMLWNVVVEHIHDAAYGLLGGQSREGALLTLQLISVSSGVGVLLVALWGARRLGYRALDSWMMALIVILSGVGLLFFGYVETYPPFLVAVTITCTAAVPAADNKLSRW